MIPVHYISSLIIFFSIYSLFSLGQNILLGYSGQPMLGFMGIVSIASYVAAALAAYHGLPFIITMPISILATVVIGASLGWLFTKGRLTGAYLVVGSIGFNYIIVGILLFTPYLGGYTGILNIPTLEIFGYPFSDPISFALLMLILMLLFSYVHWKLSRTKIGLALRALKDDEEAAESSGVDVVKFKIIAFIFASIFAAIGGCLYAYFMRVVHPLFFEFEHSVEVFAMPIVGGAGTTIGPLIGALVPTFIPEILRGYVPAETRFLIYNLLIILFVLFEPAGLLGGESRIRKALFGFVSKLRSGG
jgi:branched-chain amino acid transport system permease protein